MMRPYRLYWSVFGLLFLGMAIVGGVGLWYRFEVVPRIQTSLTPAMSPRSAVGAVWMQHKWVEKGTSEDEMKSMAASLKGFQFSDAFFHVGPLNADGTLAIKRYANSAALLRVMKREAPGVRVQAWIGQVTTTWGGPMDLANSEVRANIVATAEALLAAGFDGIHVDIEPVQDEDPAFLELLKALQEKTHAQKKVLSVASDDVEPFLGAGFITHICCGNVTFWKPAYLAKVLGFADQVAVMSYDSSLKSDELYSWFVSLMTERLASLVPEGKILFVGLPTFETGNGSFDPKVENIRSGLRGVIAGLEKSSGKDLQKRLGVALYAYWETSPEEWETYMTYWLGKSQ